VVVGVRRSYGITGSLTFGSVDAAYDVLMHGLRLMFSLYAFSGENTWPLDRLEGGCGGYTRGHCKLLGHLAGWKMPDRLGYWLFDYLCVSQLAYTLVSGTLECK
jgi:hypothetical protein